MFTNFVSFPAFLIHFHMHPLLVGVHLCNYCTHTSLLYGICVLSLPSHLPPLPLVFLPVPPSLSILFLPPLLQSPFSILICPEEDQYEVLPMKAYRTIAPHDLFLSEKIGEGQFGDVHNGFLFPKVRNALHT